MAVKTMKSGLMAKLGGALQKAVAATKNEETRYGIIPLPPGITNGIAKLVEAKFDQYKSGNNQGQYYFRAAGVVVAPSKVTLKDMTEQVVEGCQTSVMVPICATGTGEGAKSLSDNVGTCLNEMRKLGIDTSSLDENNLDLEGLAESLKEATPYFKFTTSLRKARVGTADQDGVWENWHGIKGLEDYQPEETEKDVEDNSVDTVEEETEEEEVKPGPKTKVAAVPPKKPPVKLTAKSATEPEPEEEATEDIEPEAEEVDTAALAELADASDKTLKTPKQKKEKIDAMAKLEELAMELGIEEGTIKNSPDWATVAGWIEAGGVTEEATEEEPEAEPEEEAAAEWEPAKEEVYKYKPIDPKTKKAGKAVDVEVTAVYAKTKKVDVKNLLNEKIVYKGVEWSDLIQE